MMILPGGSDFFFPIIGAIIRPTELDKVVRVYFADLFSDEFAFNIWGKVFLEYRIHCGRHNQCPSAQLSIVFEHTEASLGTWDADCST